MVSCQQKNILSFTIYVLDQVFPSNLSQTLPHQNIKNALFSPLKRFTCLFLPDLGCAGRHNGLIIAYIPLGKIVGKVL